MKCLRKRSDEQSRNYVNAADCKLWIFFAAFALKQLIENLGHSVEFVDYHVCPPLVKDNADNANKYLRKIKKGFEDIQI